MAPLDNHEQRKLAEIERALTKTDPRLARRLTEFRLIKTSTVAGLLGGAAVLFSVGLVLLVVGVAHGSPLIVIGGAIAVASLPAMIGWHLWLHGGRWGPPRPR